MNKKQNTDFDTEREVLEVLLGKTITWKIKVYMRKCTGFVLKICVMVLLFVVPNSGFDIMQSNLEEVIKQFRRSRLI